MKYRFYSPVQGIIDYDFNKDMDYDSYFDEEAMEELGEVNFDFLTAEDLTAYQEEINQAIRKEWDYETDEEIEFVNPGVKDQKVKMLLPIKCEEDWIIRRKK